MLKQPIFVGHLRLPNRLVMPPMATAKSTPSGIVTPELCDDYHRRTEGGCLGLVITEHSFVCQQGRASPSQMSVAGDDALPGLRRLSETIHRCGTPVFAQISHAGGLTSPEVTGTALVAASAVANPGRQPAGPVPRALTEEEIARIVALFIQAAVRVQKAGFDGVEIHSAHAYLLNEFYSPLTNRRSDRYGGSLENRLRIHIEILRGIRAAVGPDFPIAVRLGACDYMEGGSTLDDAVEACRILEREGVSLLDLSGGMCRYIRRDHPEPGYFSDASSLVKANVSVPVLLTGGVTTAQEAETLLADKAADLIGVGRALLQDAGWARAAMARA